MPGMKTIRLPLFALLAFSFCTLTGEAAFAKEPTSKERAKQLLKEGNLKLESGEYREAYECYRKAEEQYSSPILKYSIGNVMYRMKDYARAEVYLEHFIEAKEKKPDDLVSAAKSKLEEIKKLIDSMPSGGLLIKSFPTGASDSFLNR